MSYISGDPSDPNFTVIATPVISSPPRLLPGNGLNGDEVAAYNDLIKIQASEWGVGFAAYTSANRAQGAKDANNTYWQNVQTAQAQKYAHQLGVLLNQEIDARRHLYNALTAAAVSANVTPANVLAFEQQIASSGLPPQLAQVLQQFGLDAATINQVALLLLAQDANAAAGTFPEMLISPSLLGALQNASDALK